MSPFDGARYARLLKGLEIAELLLSEVQHENEKLRLDSGYFAAPMLAADAIARSYPQGHDELGRLFSRFVKGIFDINASAYTDDGIPFLRILNLRGGAIDDSNIAFIPEAIHQAEAKTALQRGDIVLSKTAYPAASLVTIDRCNTSQDTIATTLSSYGKATYRAETIVAYLNSEIGQRLLWRQFQGNVQLHLSLDDGRKVPVPRFGKKLQDCIAAIFQLSQVARSDGHQRSHQAEMVLARTLGLESWNAPEPLSYVRSSLEAFAAERLDAEYFTPRVLALMKLLGRDGLSIGQVAPARHEAFRASNAGSTFRYIEIGDLRNDGSVESTELATVDAPSRATQLVRAGDVLTSTVRPIRRLSAQVSAADDGAVCSSGFVVLVPTAVSASTLLTYLRLPIVCELMDLHTSASLYPALSEGALLGLPIPRVSEDVQHEVDGHVSAARAAKWRAAQLLEATKRAVEIAIEDGEAAALDHLDRVAASTH